MAPISWNEPGSSRRVDALAHGELAALGAGARPSRRRPSAPPSPPGGAAPRSRAPRCPGRRPPRPAMVGGRGGRRARWPLRQRTVNTTQGRVGLGHAASAHGAHVDAIGAGRQGPGERPGGAGRTGRCDGRIEEEEVAPARGPEPQARDLVADAVANRRDAWAAGRVAGEGHRGAHDGVGRRRGHGGVGLAAASGHRRGRRAARGGAARARGAAGAGAARAAARRRRARRGHVGSPPERRDAPGGVERSSQIGFEKATIAPPASRIWTRTKQSTDVSTITGDRARFELGFGGGGEDGRAVREVELT